MADRGRCGRERVGVDAAAGHDRVDEFAAREVVAGQRDAALDRRAAGKHTAVLGVVDEVEAVDDFAPAFMVGADLAFVLPVNGYGLEFGIHATLGWADSSPAALGTDPELASFQIDDNPWSYARVDAPA